MGVPLGERHHVIDHRPVLAARSASAVVPSSSAAPGTEGVGATVRCAPDGARRPGGSLGSTDGAEAEGTEPGGAEGDGVAAVVGAPSVGRAGSGPGERVESRGKAGLGEDCGVGSAGAGASGGAGLAGGEGAAQCSGSAIRAAAAAVAAAPAAARSRRRREAARRIAS
ncbi:hypothetical protein STPH2_3726 [Streptomyces sp. KO7888]|nr:hypothetical protein [Streptomyces sp. KO7888]